MQVKAQRFSEPLFLHWGEASEMTLCGVYLRGEEQRDTPTLSPEGPGKEAVSGIPVFPAPGVVTDTQLVPVHVSWMRE